MKCSKKIFQFFFVFILTFKSSYLIADWNSVSWIDHFENLRISFDISIRPQYNFQRDHFAHTDAIGIDLHKVFYTPNRGDFGTLILQGYFTKLNNVESHHSFYKGENDLKFICRICNFNFNILEKGLLNLRLGHAEIPFGLEYNMDTNGTLRQYSNGRTLGHKLDWGIAINGKPSWGGYEISLSRGAGIDWSDDYHSYIVAGRVEKIFGYSSFVGFSGFFGHLNNKNHTSGYIDRSRLGIDFKTEVGPFTFLGEISGGKDDNRDYFDGLLEVDIHDRSEKLLAYFQFINSTHRYQGDDWDTKWHINLGLIYTLDRRWTITSQWSHDVATFKSTKPMSLLELQLRYRF